MTGRICIVLYLSSVIAANLLVADFGPAALPYTAFFLVSIDLITRDILHEHWGVADGRRFLLRMGALILSGSVLSFLLNSQALRVAAASFSAFLLAGATNTLVYHVARHRSRWQKMNLSNAFAAVTDSIVFPLVAFSLLDFHLSASQAGAKFAGGMLWTTLFLILGRHHASRRVRDREDLSLRSRAHTG